MNKAFMTSRRTLVILAGVVWYIGAGMLLRSGLELLTQARLMRPVSNWHWLFISLGVLLGIIQAKTIFSRSCRRNLQRIRELDQPLLWQFFHPRFFLALIGMILTGVLLDYFAQGSYFFMLFVAGLDFALTISLLGSSLIFWKEGLNFS